jgi:phosphoribosylformylglycinamidine cyclo-ligase
LLDENLLKAAAHITGGGLTGNVPRVLPDDCAVEIDPKSWPSQPVFELLQRLGNIPPDDYRRTFNLGVGMVFLVGQKKRDAAAEVLKRLGEPFYEIGRVVPLSGKKQPRVAYL